MGILDIILLVLLAFFTFSGLRKGLIRSLGNLVGVIIGAFIASRFYLQVFEWGRDWAGEHEALGKVIAFIILFVAATSLTNFIFFLIEKIFNLLAFIPGSKYINNLLGGVLGLLEGSLFLGLILYVASRYAFIAGSFGEKLTDSLVVPWLIKVAGLIVPVLPEALKALQSLI